MTACNIKGKQNSKCIVFFDFEAFRLFDKARHRLAIHGYRRKKLSCIATPALANGIGRGIGSFERLVYNPFTRPTAAVCGIGNDIRDAVESTIVMLIYATLDISLEESRQGVVTQVSDNQGRHLLFWRLSATK